MSKTEERKQEAATASAPLRGRTGFLPSYTGAGARFSIAAFMALAAAALAHLPLMRAVDQRAYDLMARMAGRTQQPAEEIVIVAYDEESLARMEPVVGSWPWPRMLHAPLIEYCSGAAVIGMDLLLSERQWQYRETGDPILVRTVQQHGSRMLFAAHFHDAPGDAPPAEDLKRMSIRLEGDASALPTFSSVILPFDDLLGACRSVGDVNVRRDSDGAVRRYQALVGKEGRAYPSFALSALSLFADVPCEEIRWGTDRVLHVGKHTLRLEKDGSFPFLPVAAPYPVYSAVDVIDSFNAEGQGREPVVPREAFENKIVLIGATAYGLHDHAVTPLHTATPGVMLHAMALQNLLQGMRIELPPGWLVFLLIFLLALYPAGLRHSKPWRMAGVVVGLLAVYGLLMCLAALQAQIVLPLVGPVGAIFLSSSALSAAYWSEERARRGYIESLDRAKQLFTDMLVHDLKNTLAPITMSLSMRGESDAEDLADVRFWTQDFPEIVSTSSNRLMTQINALLDIRRMQEGRMQLKVESTDVHALLQRTLADYQVAAARTGLALALESRIEPGTCALVDSDVFARIMDNLIWNAIKYAVQGSTVVVQAKVEGADRLQVIVCNEGKPISPALQRDLFIAFVTGPPPDDLKKIPSTGLGLTFCKLAAEAHGGAIRLDSPVPGEEGGVQVQITFPCAPPA